MFTWVGLLLLPLVASAQQAQLSGVVSDAQSAAVAGAEVKLSEPSTGLVLTARTNEQGAYVFASVRPSTYRLEVVADGFARFTREHLELHVDQRAVLNLPLKLGDRNEEITVSALRPLLGMADGSLGTVIDRRMTENLPLRGRTFSSLVALVPGVITAAPASGDGSEFRVNGQRSASNALIVDGVSAPSEMGAAAFEAAGGQRFSTTVTGAINGGLSIDAVQEIHVQTSTFAAEFGRTPGAQISLVTRSGANRLTGSLFGQLRNDNMSANDWFANSTNTPKPESKEHQFGGALGGPIVRGRLFFFATYEGLRLDRPQFTRGFVPTLEVRQQASVVSRALNVYPLPNNPARADGTAEFTAFTPLEYRSDTWGLRLDHTLHNVQLFGRFSSTPSTQDTGSPFVSDALLEKGAKNLTVGMTTTLGTATLVEVRANYNDADYRTSGRTPLRDFFPADVPETAWASFGAGNLATLFTGNRVNNLQRTSNVIASLSRVRGTHQIKIGTDYRAVLPEDEARRTMELRFTSLAQALVGATATMSATYRMPAHATFQNFSLYAQDSWKVRPRLSLMYGLRWDVNPPPEYRDGEGPLAVATFEPISSLKMSAGRNVPLWKTDYTGFFPRLGFSYVADAEGRTILSGGVGRFGDLDAPAAGVATSISVGASTQVSPPVTFPLTPQTVLAPETPSLVPPYSSANVFVVDPSLSTPNTTQWNLTVQRSLGSSHEVSLSYVGARGDELLQNTRYPPRIAPDFLGTVWAVSNGGRSRYTSLQASYRGRVIRGLDSLLSYTLGDMKETQSRLNFGNKSSELTPSGSDVRHLFNAAVTWTPPDVGSVPLAQIWQGWGLHLVATARSGFPFSVRSSDFASVAGQEFNPERYASLVPGVPIVIEDQNAPGGTRFNRAAFVDPPAGEQGNTTANQFRGFGMLQFDAGLQRSVRLTGTLKVRARIDAFNVFNTPTFSQPIGLLNSQFFGVPTIMQATGLQSLYRVGGPRTVAVSLRLEF